MQNPFTTTFSKAPEHTYISTDEPAEIIDNFSYETPAESVYKITGVRGSGKTVSLAKVEEEFTNDKNRDKGWLVYRLNASRDMLAQFAAFLYKEPFIKEKLQSGSISISASIFGTGGGLGISTEKSGEFFDIGVEIDEMLKAAARHSKKVLISVDEVSKTSDMIRFAGEFGNWLRAGYPVYLVCTGLYGNIQELSNVKNLTFFRRATTVKTGPLNYIRMTEMYRDKLKVSLETAKILSGITGGYAYAFQELGTIYFKKNDDEGIDEVVARLKSDLFAYSYEKIWEELTEGDRRLCRLIADGKEHKREEIIGQMGTASGNYSVYRDRLLKRGIITARQGYITLALPYFGDYIEEYGT